MSSIVSQCAPSPKTTTEAAIRAAIATGVVSFIIGNLSGKPMEIKTNLVSVLSVFLFAEMTKGVSVGSPEHGVGNIIKLRPSTAVEAKLASFLGACAFAGQFLGAELRRRGYGEEFATKIDLLDKILKERFQDKFTETKSNSPKNLS